MIVTTEPVPKGCVHAWKLTAVGRVSNLRGGPTMWRYVCDRCASKWEGRNPRKMPRQAMK